MADGIVLEGLGVPAAVICTDAFRASVTAMAKVKGFPGYRYIAVPHPVASRTGTELHDIAEQVADEITEILTAPA